jgi:hypothetical protein
MLLGQNLRPLESQGSLGYLHGIDSEGALSTGSLRLGLRLANSSPQWACSWALLQVACAPGQPGGAPTALEGLGSVALWHWQPELMLVTQDIGLPGPTPSRTQGRLEPSPGPPVSRFFGKRGLPVNPVSRFTGIIGKRAGNRESPFPDSAANGNRGPARGLCTLRAAGRGFLGLAGLPGGFW